MAEQVEVKELDKFEVIPKDPKKKKGLVRLLVIPGINSTTFAATFEKENGDSNFISHLVNPVYIGTPQEREEAEKKYVARVQSYFDISGYEIKR